MGVWRVLSRAIIAFAFIAFVSSDQTCRDRRILDDVQDLDSSLCHQAGQDDSACGSAMFLQGLNISWRWVEGSLLLRLVAAPTYKWIAIGVSHGGGMNDAHIVLCNTGDTDLVVQKQGSKGEVFVGSGEIEELYSATYGVPRLSDTSSRNNNQTGCWARVGCYISGGGNEDGRSLFLLRRPVEATFTKNATQMATSALQHCTHPIQAHEGTELIVTASHTNQFNSMPPARARKEVIFATGRVQEAELTWRQILYYAHGAVLGFVWALLTTTAACIARYCRSWKYWFLMHKNMQLCASCLTTPIAIMALYFKQKHDAGPTEASSGPLTSSIYIMPTYSLSLHGGIGMAVGVLSLLQTAVGERVSGTHLVPQWGILRGTCPFKPLNPKRDFALRTFHTYNGRFLLFLAVVQTFIGVRLPPILFLPAPSAAYKAWTTYGYSAYVSTLIALVLVLEVRRVKPRRGFHTGRRGSTQRRVSTSEEAGADENTNAGSSSSDSRKPRYGSLEFLREMGRYGSVGMTWVTGEVQGARRHLKQAFTQIKVVEYFVSAGKVQKREYKVKQTSKNPSIRGMLGKQTASIAPAQTIEPIATTEKHIRPVPLSSSGAGAWELDAVDKQTSRPLTESLPQTSSTAVLVQVGTVGNKGNSDSVASWRQYKSRSPLDE